MSFSWTYRKKRNLKVSFFEMATSKNVVIFDLEKLLPLPQFQKIFFGILANANILKVLLNNY